MNFKKMLPLGVKPVVLRIYWFSIIPFNIIWYYLFHKKFISGPEQRALWEERNEKDLGQIEAVEKDPYYQKFDLFILDKLKKFNSDTYLEVGCYYGYRLNKFAAKLNDKKFIGLDIGLQNLILGKERIIKSSNVSLVNANASTLPFENNSIETIYTIVCLTHIDYSSINKVVDELVRVCSNNLLLIEVDHRYMKLRKKLECLNWDYGYMHPYEKIIANRMNLVSITPLYDFDHHPRYTAFQFLKEGVKPQ